MAEGRVGIHSFFYYGNFLFIITSRKPHKAYIKQKTAKEGSSLYNKGIVTDALIGTLNSMRKTVDCIH